MARLSREASRALTRERLIESSRQVYVEKGIGAATVDEIAERADFSKGAFYSNFESKEDLFLELLRRHMQDELTALEGILKGANSLDGFLHELWLLYTAMEKQPDACILALEFQLYAYRNRSFLVTFKDLFGAHRRTLSKLLERAASQVGASLTRPAEEVMTTLMGMTTGILLQNFISPAYRAGMAADMIVLYLRSELVPKKRHARVE